MRGALVVARGSDLFELNENQSTYVSFGMRRRLESPGDDPLHLIEVQSGSYVGEDGRA